MGYVSKHFSIFGNLVIPTQKFTKAHRIIDSYPNIIITELKTGYMIKLAILTLFEIELNISDYKGEMVTMSDYQGEMVTMSDYKGEMVTMSDDLAALYATPS